MTTTVEVIEDGVTVEVATVVQIVEGGAGGGDHPDSDHAGLATSVALTAEGVTRAAADTALDVRVDALESAPGGGGGDHPDVDHEGLTTVIAGLASEITTRGSADTSLDGRLDVIEALGPLATDIEVANAVAAHAGLLDPHPGYLTPAEGNAAYDAAGAAAAAQAFSIQRGNHTGSQAQSTITNLVGDLAAKADLVGGKVPDSQMGSLTISEHLGVVASQAAMLALVGQRGDWATRSDLSADFMVIAEPTSSLGNWRQFTTPASPVSSVNGRVGAVTGLAEAANLTAEISRATAAELLLAPLASPSFTGNPVAPTQTAGNNSTRLATTAFVAGAATTAADAKVADAINDGTTTVAPSQNAVFDALALKATTSTLGTAATANKVAAGAVGVLDATDATTTNSRTPSGSAGGVLSGTYPNPGFAVDMATQGELDTHAVSGVHTAAQPPIIGATATTAVAGNDSRLTDTRTPSTASVTPPKMAASVALTDGANIAIDASLGEVFKVTFGGNRTFDNPTNLTPGQTFIIRVKQDAVGSRTASWDTKYRGSTDVPLPTLTTTPLKTDYIGFKYNADDDKCDCLAVSKGY